MTRFTPHYPIKRFCCWVIPIFLLQISSSWVKIRLPTENQLPRLPVSWLFDFVSSSQFLVYKPFWLVECYRGYTECYRGYTVLS